MRAIPKTLGKYDILGEAGRGNMGVVYAGHDPFVDRKVAIKVLASERPADDPAAIRAKRMFFNEARSAGHLDHPNILRIYDAGEYEGQPFMVTEFVEGARNLRQYTASGEGQPVEWVVTLMAQCASALNYAHERGVIHRDIKPANIMLTQQGTVKIVDFGIAQRDHADATMVLGVVGSPRYMSPESAQDNRASRQSDIYSLGVVMYELLAGRPPFQAATLPALLQKILSEPPEPLESVRPDVPEDLCRIIYKAIDKDPARRYQSGLELETDLRAFASGRPTTRAEPDDDAKLGLLKGLRFFHGFPEGDLREAIRAGRWVFFEPGAEVVKEGGEDKTLYFLVEGRVSVSRKGRTIAILEAGECFGEMAYLSGRPRTATVAAVTEVAALAIDTPLGQWAPLASQLRFNKAFQQLLIARLDGTSGRLAEA